MCCPAALLETSTPLVGGGHRDPCVSILEAVKLPLVHVQKVSDLSQVTCVEDEQGWRL